MAGGAVCLLHFTRVKEVPRLNECDVRPVSGVLRIRRRPFSASSEM